MTTSHARPRGLGENPRALEVVVVSVRRRRSDEATRATMESIPSSFPRDQVRDVWRCVRGVRGKDVCADDDRCARSIGGFV